MRSFSEQLTFLQSFVEEVEKTWASQQHNPAALPQLAAEALRELPAFTPPAMSELIKLLPALKLPQQSYPEAQFSDLPLTIARAGKLHLDLYYWYHSDTSIHNHHFSGAFKVVHGSSFQFKYDFKLQQRIGTDLELGEVKKIEEDIIPLNGVHAIALHDAFIHQVFHLQLPTITLCLRSTDYTGMNLWGFVLPKYKILYRELTHDQKKWIQVLRNLHRFSPQDVPAMLEDIPLSAGEILKSILQINAGDKPIDPVNGMLLERLKEKGIAEDFYECLQAQYKLGQKVKKFGMILDAKPTAENS